MANEQYSFDKLPITSNDLKKFFSSHSDYDRCNRLIVFLALLALTTLARSVLGFAFMDDILPSYFEKRLIIS